MAALVTMSRMSDTGHPLSRQAKAPRARAFDGIVDVGAKTSASLARRLDELMGYRHRARRSNVREPSL